VSDNLKFVSKNTLKKDVLYLKQEGLIEVIGQGKGTFYITKKEN